VIRKVLQLKNVGPLRKAVPDAPVDFDGCTLIYAENGRGKSMFVATLRACADLDSGRLHALRTIDCPEDPEVSLLLQEQGKNVPIRLANGQWSGDGLHAVVFDSEFVEENVYAGFEVRPDQRQSLLEFVLGEQTVKLKQQVDTVTQQIEEQTKLRTQAEKTLAAHATPYTVPDFVALAQSKDADRELSGLEKRLQATRNAQTLGARRDPKELPLVEFEVSAMFDLLDRSLEDIETGAEAAVRAHLEKHDAAELEDWISRGQSFLSLETCPFCGQSLSGLDLIGAYKAYFSQAYRELKRDIDDLEGTITDELSDANVHSLRAATETNTALIEAWRDQRELEAPTLASDDILALLKPLREQLLSLVTKKRQEPLGSLGSPPEKVKAEQSITSINAAITAYNAAIKRTIKEIEALKAALVSEDSASLQHEIQRVSASQRRYRQDVIDAIAEWEKAGTEKTRLEGEKAQLRAQIDEHMRATLEQYEAAINKALQAMGAEFHIEGVKPSYVGTGEPRTEYALSIRGCSVKLGTRDDCGVGPCFGTTLSEGDKRTLAFAFFIARLETDAGIGEKIVVFDDPVCSLDRPRRYQTVSLLRGLAPQCCQIIVLSHDPYFLRELRDAVVDLRPTPMTPKVVMLERVQDDYSAFAPCDLDDVCSSDYYRHHRLVGEYVDGTSNADRRDVAKVIRPLLEGYYHRRFPLAIPRGMRLGQIISLAVNAAPPSPLVNIQPVLERVSEVNEYATQFQHDTKADNGNVPVSDGELRQFARKALELIHGNG
jgi:wobble nucleotide-excising tRNase